MEHSKLAHVTLPGQSSTRDLTLERRRISNCSIYDTGCLSSPSLPPKARRTPESHRSLARIGVKVREAGADVRKHDRRSGINVVDTLISKEEGRQAKNSSLPSGLFYLVSPW